MTDETARKHHWETVWTEKQPAQVSWHEQSPTRSLELIAHAGIAPGDPLIDVGGGASRLVDCLLEQGYGDITVLDLSARALWRVRQRLADAAGDVHWIEADVTRFEPVRRYSLWHDRAAFHFLVEPADRRRYVDVLGKALFPGGNAIIATFAPGGPQRCSGLDVERYDAKRLAGELGAGFTLQEQSAQVHVTPGGREQRFCYYRFSRDHEDI